MITLEQEEVGVGGGKAIKCVDILYRERQACELGRYRDKAAKDEST